MIYIAIKLSSTYISHKSLNHTQLQLILFCSNLSIIIQFYILHHV